MAFPPATPRIEPALVTPRTGSVAQSPLLCPPPPPSPAPSSTPGAKSGKVSYHRKSEPGRGHVTPATAPSPLRRRSGGWEFPMSREEKKQRIMELYEAELAQERRWQGLGHVDEDEQNDEDEADRPSVIPTIPEIPASGPADSVSASAGASGSTDHGQQMACKQEEPEYGMPVRQPSAVAAGGPAFLGAAAGFALLLLAAGLYFGPPALRAPGTSPGEGASISASANCTLDADTVAATLAAAVVAAPDGQSAGSADPVLQEAVFPLAPAPTRSTALPAAPATASFAAFANGASSSAPLTAHAAVKQQLPPAASVAAPSAAASAREFFDAGLAKLSVSDCWTAEKFFADALRLLSDTATVQAEIKAGPIRQAVNKSEIEGNMGFALVCSQRWDQGAKLLERSQQTSPRLMNALGFARFHLKDYPGASDAFEAATKADPLNPILWNNLGAARMSQKPPDIRGADDAMYRAVDQTESGGTKHYHMDEYFRRIFLENTRRLSLRASWTKDSPARGLELGMPQVELWGGEGQL